MKKQSWLITLLLILTVLLSGCGALEVEEEHLEPLDAAAWPTAQAATAIPSPTPFPQAALVAVSAPAPAAPPAIIAPDSSDLALDSSAGTAPQAGFQGFSNLPAVAAAFVTVDGAAARQTPDPASASVGSIERGALVGILGKNATGDWLFVLTSSLVRGWLPTESLRVTGTVAQAPLLPPDLLAISTSQTGPAATTALANEAAGSANTSRLVMAELKPVATAQVKSDGLNNAPGARRSLCPT